MKICFLAPSGYGKSTAIEILKNYFDIKNIKIAEPLYELQNEFYKKIGLDDENKQDGELLQFYGKKIRSIDKKYLLNIFKEKLDKCTNNIITNDDCRPDDYEYLKSLGFIFIRINGFKRDRNDITNIDNKNKIEWQSNIPFDYEIDNFGSLLDYEKELVNLFRNILSLKCYIIPTQKLCNNDCIFCISKSRDYNKECEFLDVSDEFIENIYKLKKHGIKRFEITGGGEPFLNNNLSNIVLSIRKIIPDAYIKLYTNGNILKRIEGIDEIDISIVSNDISINNKFMNGNNIELIDKLKFFKNDYVKLRLSIPLIKGAIDTKEKLDSFIDETKDYVDEYVVRTLYPDTKNINEMYVNFQYERDNVIIERDNDVKEFKDIILWSDNKFYNSWDLNNNRYFYSYLLLKPDSKTYINEIEDMIKKYKFNIVNRFILNDFKNNSVEFYIEKDDEYLNVIRRHLDNLDYLFGDKALVYILDKDKIFEELYYDTLVLKNKIRDMYSFSYVMNGFINRDNNLSHVNLVHCPNVDSKIYDRDLNYIFKSDLNEIDDDKLVYVKKFRSYDV